jgi:hypothetical protein
MQIKQLLNEWKKYLTEEEIDYSKTPIKPSIQEPAPKEYTKDMIKQKIISACSMHPNIKPDFATAVAFRESSLRPTASKGSYYGVFSVGLNAAKDLGRESAYTEEKDSVFRNIDLGVSYLQFNYNKLIGSGILDKYKKMNFSDYVLTYIAYNLGYTSMLDIVGCLIDPKRKPKDTTVKFIIAQSPRFQGANDRQTVRKYYNDIVAAFGKF